MIEIIGVRFKANGKVYYFSPGDHQFQTGDLVVVETSKGTECGEVTIPNKTIQQAAVVQPLKQILRPVNKEDRKTLEQNRKKEIRAFHICEEKIAMRKLEMKLIEVECAFDNSKLLFYFTAENRVDFRDLVKDLAAIFRTRIELRQIGVRDKAKILGGIGICGREFCCKGFLCEFQPVSIKMAKEQGLSLNPAKISGCCGRLMCCLKNEEETYEYLNSRLPAVNDTVTTEDGLKGEVHSVNVLRQTVKVVVEVGDEKEIREYDVKQLKFKPRRRKEKNGGAGKQEEKELKKLEAMEKKEGKSKLNDN